VEIEVDIQVVPVEVIDASGKALARARPGLLNTELVQQPGNYMIDELRAVIGMKAENLEGELGDCFLQGGLEMGAKRANTDSVG
jgi:hypothetical protein